MTEPTPEEALLAPRFAALGLGDKPLKEALRNKKIATAWTEVLQEANIQSDTTGLDPKVGGALAALVTGTKDTGSLGGKREYVAKAIKDGRLKSNVQVDAAVKHIKGLKGEIDDQAFDTECGVGRSPALAEGTGLTQNRN